MTRRERAIRDRFWLKIHRFAVTRSLKDKLAERCDLTDRQREFCCYIQNKVLRETREEPNQFANIGAKYWEDKCGGGYRRWVDLLVGLGELHLNPHYRKGTDADPGFTMSYRVPLAALESGVTKIDFTRKATSIKDQTDLDQANDIIRFVHRCCSRLTIPETLVDIPEPVRDAAAHEFSRRVFWGDFNIRYGEKGHRLYHSIIEMPKEARANLVWKTEGGPPLFEYDIKSCQPVLLLPLFSNPLEKAKYSLLLDSDIYTRIRDSMGGCEDRDGMKIQFMIYTNSMDRDVAGKRGVVRRFFERHFPIFSREVLDLRSDMAAYLQQQESKIMVQALGRFCMEKDYFWIPCHDGWLGIEQDEGDILKKVGEAFLQATGYPVRIERTGLADGNSKRVDWCYGSYVRSEPTSTPSPEYRKSAEDWFSSLPKHPEPNAETLKKRQDARQRQKEAFRDERLRDREAEDLRRQAGPLWTAHKAGLEGDKAA